MPGGFLVLHFEHVNSLLDLAIGLPQLLQNLLVAGFLVLHSGHVMDVAGTRLAPQLPQNFIPDTFLEAHFWQIISS